MKEIKICGITNLSEIKFLNELIPSYIGLVFTESKRKVDIEKAIELCEILNPLVKTVAVFRNEDYQYISEVLNSVSINIVQLHGSESIDLIRKIKENFKVEIWKALSLENIKNEGYLNSEYIEKLLIDSPNPGSGQKFNWNTISNISFNKDIFLAGGINLSNIDEALTLENINGVDLSSGVEWINEDGKREKSYIKVKEIIEKVREHNER